MQSVLCIIIDSIDHRANVHQTPIIYIVQDFGNTAVNKTSKTYGFEQLMF